MKIAKIVLAVLMGIFLILGGINHFVNPAFYNAMIPDFFPKLAVNYVTGFVEIIPGIGLLIPRYRHLSGLAVMVLMIAFLPIHVWDVLRNDPAIGSHTAALIRLPFQFVLITWAWFVSRQ